MSSAPPCSVSSDFGQLVVMRHLSSGIDCAIAGAASVAAPAAPIPVTFRKSRRFMEFLPSWLRHEPSFARLAASMEHPVCEFHPEPASADAKNPGLFAETGLAVRL